MATRVRFAPSPTGYLHIGGVRTALFNWLWARKQSGVLVLRIEDTDRERSSMESTKAIVDSLRWLGLDWDEGPFMQTERLGIYQKYAEQLIHDGKAYRCYCTKEKLEADRQALKANGAKAQFRYPGTCRDRKDQPDAPFVVRFKTRTGSSTTYVDKVFGKITTPNVEQQDFVLLRNDGVPLYNFGAVIDDMTMGITLVARGSDHLINTPSQLLLYEALGAVPPEFAHLPMMLAPSGEKLGKRHGAVSVAEYRSKGFSPSAVLNYLARFGWSHGDDEIFSKKALIDAFDWASCGRADGKFDSKKFAAINHAHLKNPELVSDDEYARRLLPFLVNRELPTPSLDSVRSAVPLVRERATTFVDAAERLDFIFRTNPVMDEAAMKTYLTYAAAPTLRAFASQLEGMTIWDAGALEKRTERWLQEGALRMKDVAQPARVALTGSSASPGLFDVLAALGQSESLRRLKHGVSLAEEGESK